MNGPLDQFADRYVIIRDDHAHTRTEGGRTTPWPYLPCDCGARIHDHGGQLLAVVPRRSVMEKRLRGLARVRWLATRGLISAFTFPPAAFPAVAAILLPERLPAPEQPEPDVPYGRRLAMGAKR